MKSLKTLLNRGIIRIAFMSFMFISCNENEEGDGSVRISVRINWEGERLGLNDSYTTSSGEFTIEDFKFYLSNLNFQGEEINFSEAESYHLVKASENGESYEILIEGVPGGTYDRIRYGIGVDPEKNLSIDNEGDLDPTNQMAWNWDTGYKFVLCEGKLDNPDLGTIALVYHIGFSENYFEQTDNVDAFVVADGVTTQVVMDVEVDELFKNPNQIDVTILNNVMFNKEEVSLFVENYKNGMFSF